MIVENRRGEAAKEGDGGVDIPRLEGAADLADEEAGGVGGGGGRGGGRGGEEEVVGLGEI